MRVTLDLAEDESAHPIVEHTQQSSDTLIMMPTRGYAPFRSLLLGSVTAMVLLDAPCPVWTGAR
jgi:nucleotide-binding universal stress UspA family protein